MKILLVEDELLIQKSLKMLLERQGAEVTTETLGKKAIEQIHNNHFDRIICDLMLGDISGFDVIEEAKQRYSIQDIGNKFIIITAYSSAHVLQKASTYGCPVLSKPFENINDAIKIFINKE
jgi:CheY-like chemotaxis protein